MQHLRLASSVLGLLALALAPSAQQVSWFLGPPGGPGEVAIFDQATGVRLAAQPELENVVLLPIEFVGRTALDALLTSVPRLASDIPGAARVVLPNAQGSLYRFRRDEEGGSVFGYFWIDGGGLPRVVLERPAADGLDPWLGKVSIAPDGRAFLAATRAGEVLEVELASGLVQARGLASGIQTNGLALLAEWGVVTTGSAVLRFERDAGAVVAPVPFVLGTPAFLGSGVMPSADGSTVAAIGGASAQSAHVWVIGRAGSAARVSTSAMRLSGPGFLPEEPNGPFLALSPAGTACLWRSIGESSEAWVRRTQLAAPPAVQVTRNAIFEDTLDSTGEFGFFNELEAIVLVGEPDDTTGIEGADVYRIAIDPATGATTTTNLSQTSGVLSPPFANGELETAAGIWRVDGGAGLIAHIDLSSNEGQLGTVRFSQPGFTVLREHVAAIEALAPAGADVALVARGSSDESELLSVPTTLDGVTLHASLPEDFSFDALATAPGGWAGVLLDVPGGRWVARVHLPTSTAAVLIEHPLPLGDTLGFTPGRLAFSLDFSPQRSLGVSWSPAGEIGLYPTGGLPGHLLP